MPRASSSGRSSSQRRSSATQYGHQWPRKNLSRNGGPRRLASANGRPVVVRGDEVEDRSADRDRRRLAPLTARRVQRQERRRRRRSRARRRCRRRTPVPSTKRGDAEHRRRAAARARYGAALRGIRTCCISRSQLHAGADDERRRRSTPSMVPVIRPPGTAALDAAACRLGTMYVNDTRARQVKGDRMGRPPKFSRGQLQTAALALRRRARPGRPLDARARRRARHRADDDLQPRRPPRRPRRAGGRGGRRARRDWPRGARDDDWRAGRPRRSPRRCGARCAPIRTRFR